MARLPFFIAVAFLCPYLSFAQSPADTLLLLDPVTISASRWHGVRRSPTTQSADSLSLTDWKQDDLRAWLGSASAAYIKDYGPGQSATLSIRGGNAGHTAVQWNGFPLQHPMLGLVDLSLFPMAFFDAAHLEHGANAAGWGSGAVGGVLHLDNQLTTTENGQALHAGIALGSFSDYRAHFALTKKMGDWVWTSRAFHRQADNDFPFIAEDGTSRVQSHAHFQSSGWMNGGTRLGKQSKLSVYSWLQQAQRELPPSLWQADNQATQQDGIIRHIVDYKYWKNQLETNLRAAWFRESLTYEDPTYSYLSESISNSGWMEATAAWKPGKPGTRLEAGIQQGLFLAQSGDYAQSQHEGRSSLFGGLTLPFSEGTIQLHLRREWNGGLASPWIPSAQLTLRSAKPLTFFARASRTYRWPTLNDRFWVYGGNPTLQPENGWNTEAGATWKQQRQQTWSASLNTYLRYMQDWIQWIPGDDQIWRPQNIQQVRSQGAEAMLRMESKVRSGKIWMQTSCDLTIAKPTQSTWADDPALGKQLIYVPFLKNASQLGWRNARWQAVYRHTWNSTTYTVADHSASLPALHLGQLDLGWRTENPWIPSITCSIRNVWNTSYQSVASWAMPGRNVLIQLNW